MKRIKTLEKPTKESIDQQMRLGYFPRCMNNEVAVLKYIVDFLSELGYTRVGCMPSSLPELVCEDLNPKVSISVESENIRTSYKVVGGNFVEDNVIRTAYTPNSYGWLIKFSEDVNLVFHDGSTKLLPADSSSKVVDLKKSCKYIIV